jgi:hypothetical protein
MKKISFTKFVMGVMLSLNIALVVFVCRMVWTTGDLSPVPYLMLGEGGPLGVWLAGYTWKEKAANKSKYAMQYVDRIAAEHGFDSAIRMAEIVLQE